MKFFISFLYSSFSWIDADSDTENEGDSTVKKEEGSSSVNKENSVQVKEEVSSIKLEME